MLFPVVTEQVFDNKRDTIDGLDFVELPVQFNDTALYYPDMIGGPIINGYFLVNVNCDYFKYFSADILRRFEKDSDDVFHTIRLEEIQSKEACFSFLLFCVKSHSGESHWHVLNQYVGEIIQNCFERLHLKEIKVLLSNGTFDVITPGDWVSGFDYGSNLNINEIDSRFIIS
jgi:hypothetical protein